MGGACRFVTPLTSHLAMTAPIEPEVAYVLFGCVPGRIAGWLPGQRRRIR
jgi:hypothetical protein